ncbi:hypothetical protein, variant [Plasmodium yoelii 17X]|uniref:Fam-a protein n=3 Tax=Plasmodium yoelii TaxID=5861 RepID=A0AAF0B2Y3_PLAYO|nr:fam-a protein [Plasmodium yoelii]ETB62108.1 hypothetical protein YYC_01113 [Plasmodium yoelii 17X]WBY56221.1 fam-a protein [Plasmodium yoelii yoelii]ETB62109.1 hypothetical protein, variant [Plasmodium yoelii 17X]CDU17128.1 fam-a protein [Plasmodium yoelii]VTZ76195.1 fam-a protein [Plasmodium yoelii]|eukprot:XP_022811740.1 fam-a protein [Plasmodium yoelii]
MNRGYIKTMFALFILLLYARNRAFASESISDVGDSNTVSTQNIANLDENHENGDLLACTDYEEVNKASEIMDDVIDRLKYYGNYNSNYSCYYTIEERGFISFTDYGGIDVAKFYLKIRDPNKYDQIVKMLYEAKDSYGFGSNDNKAKIVREYYPNLTLIQKYSDTPFHKYSFGLFTIVEESNTTIFANTSININDETSANKKKGEKDVNLSNNHIDFDDVIRQIVLKNLFTNFFGFIITKKHDNVCITYVESNRDDKSYPEDSDKRKRRAQNMLNLMNTLLYDFKS